MDVSDSKIAYKQLLMENTKLSLTVATLKANPFRTAAVCLGVLCVLLVAGLIGQSVTYSKGQKENENKLQSVNAEKNGVQASLTKLLKEKSFLDNSRKELEERLQQTERRRDQIQTAYSSLAEDANNVRTSERTLRINNERLTRDVLQLNVTANRLQKENNILSTGRDLYHVQLEQAIKQKNTIEANYKTVATERNNLQNSLNNASRFTDQLQLSYNNLMTKVENLEKQLHLTTVDKDKAETSHLNASTARDVLQDMYDILVKATEQLNASYTNKVREKQELEKSCESIRAERISLLEQNGNLTAERDQLQVTVTTLNATIAAKRCPSGWRSFMLSCYYSSTIKKNWKNSRDNCKGKGADLAVITSQEEMNFINGLYSSDKEVWIGLSDDGIEGHWFWVDGTPLNANATFWGSGQPNSHEGRNQDCVEFWHRTNGHGEWNDESCKIEQYFICEM